MFILSACGSAPEKESLDDIDNTDNQQAPDPQPNVDSDPAPQIFYQGRIDSSDDDGTVIIWQGTQLQSEFTGGDLKIGFKNVSGQVYFDLEVDGQVAMLQAENGWVTSPIQLSDETHEVRLFKRSEADVGQATFIGLKGRHDGEEFTLFNTPNVSVSNRNNYDYKFLFFGDSITAGACNEDPGEDQWEDYSTHNNALSYGALTAENLNAEYRNVSVSGMGITMGYNKLLFKEVWDRVYPDPNSEKVNFDLWQPDVIFTNFGENDDSYSKSQNLSFPSNYTSEYVSVVRNIREAYPDSKIVILRGGMWGGAQSERLRGPWEDVVRILEGEDSNIESFVFNHWASQHPRVSDHRTMANELTSWLRSNLN